MILKWLGVKEPEPMPSVPSLVSKADVVKVDLTYLREMSKGDDEFIKDMIEIFLNDVPSAIQQMQSALEASNWSKVGDIAHRIKSNYMMLGMKTQQNISLLIEKGIKQNEFEPEEFSKMIYQLKNDTKLAIPLLEYEITELSIA